MYRARKLRWRRKAKQRKQRVEELGVNAGKNFDKLFSERLARLLHVRRFVIGWLLLMVLFFGILTIQTRSLGGYFLKVSPVAGGTFIEGASGILTNANPLFASGVVDSSVSKLVFSGLLTYNQDNKLVGDLAERWAKNEAGTKYTLTLREGLKWHDGTDLTTEDVVFTFTSAQNADVKSPYFHSWKDVVIEKKDERTVEFTLKAVFAPFEHSLTTGIIPKHLLEDVEPTQLRSSLFNTVRPVGSGPYKLNTLEIIGNRPEERQQNIGLVAYDDYHFGRPKIDNFVLKTFIDNETLIKAYLERRVDAMLGLNQIPEELPDESMVYETPTSAIQMAFFNTEEILEDSELRKALVQSINKKDVFNGLGYSVIPADSPFLRNSFAYRGDLVQALEGNVQDAIKTLKNAKYAKNQQGFFEKDKKAIEIRIIGKNSFENALISKVLQQAWEALGIKTEVILQEEQDLQISIDTRNYDVLLNSISIGTDPDVYAYWHSAQADTRAIARLNFSNYKSEIADTALDAGRSRADSKLRAAKYRPFLQEWLKDNPAISFYQPRFLYITRGEVFFYNPKVINTSVDRLNNVHNWMIKKDHIRLLR